MEVQKSKSSGGQTFDRDRWRPGVGEA